MKATKLPANPFNPETIAMIARELSRPGLVILQYFHDDYCPALRTQREQDCRPPCHPDVYLVRPFDRA